MLQCIVHLIDNCSFYFIKIDNIAIIYAKYISKTLLKKYIYVTKVIFYVKKIMDRSIIIIKVNCIIISD